MVKLEELKQQQRDFFFYEKADCFPQGAWGAASENAFAYDGLQVLRLSGFILSRRVPVEAGYHGV